MRLFRLRRILFYIFIFFISLVLTISLSILSFLYFDVPVFIFCFIFFLSFFLFFSIYFFIFAINKIKNIHSDLEKEIFGKRLFILDTYEEASIKNQSLSEKIKTLIEKNEQFIQFYKNEEKKLFKNIVFFIFIIAIITTFDLSLINKIQEKIHNIKIFLKSDFKVNIPEYYIINKDIKIELIDYNKYDKTIVYISNLIFEVKTNQLIIPEKLSSDISLKIKIFAQKYGLTKKIAEKTLKGTTKFLPARIQLIINYPFINQSYEIEGIQDVEVYKGANITIKGEMTKEIKEIFCLNCFPKFEGRNFNTTIKIDKTQRVNIKLIAFDNDVYEIKDLNIKLLPNFPPELKIEFPKEEVIIKAFPWKLTALLRAIDDQGIKRIIVHCVVENEAKYLKNLSYKQEFSYETPMSKEIEYKIPYSSREIELLPGDRATFYVRALDLFGVSSKVETFSIYAPGFEWIDKMSESNIKQIYSILSNLSRADVFNENIDYKGIEKDKAISELSNLIEKLNETEKIFGKDISYEETKEIIDKMKDITKKLDDFLKNKDEFFMPIMGEKQNPVEMKFDNPKEYLWQMEKLLDSLKKQREFLKKQLQIEEMKKLLSNLSEEKEREKFDEKLRAYKDYIKSKKDEFDRNLMNELEKEAENLSMGKEESFKKSFELIEKLAETIQQGNKKQKENFKKQTEDILTFMLEETIIDTMVIEKLKKSIFNFSILPENSVITTKSIKSSVLNLKKIYREKLGFYFLIYKDYYKVLSILEKVEKDISDLEDHLRERRNYNFFMSLPRVIIGFNRLYISLREFNDFLNSKEFENLTEQSQTISLDNIIRMQQMITGGLKKMLSEKQGSPEYQQLKEELEKLQRAINESLAKLLKEGNLSGGKDIEEDMKDILKDIIEEKVTDKTIEKSRKLEEKLLKSKKGLTKKGLEEERKAESAKEYEITPPEDLIFKPELKKNFFDITNKDLPSYYKIMIERYRREMEK